MTSITFLHVSAAECHPRGGFTNKGIQDQQTGAETCRSLILVTNYTILDALVR